MNNFTFYKQGVDEFVNENKQVVKVYSNMTNKDTLKDIEQDISALITI